MLLIVACDAAIRSCQNRLGVSGRRYRGYRTGDQAHATLSRNLADMRDGDVIAIQTLPLGQAIEQCDRGLSGRQQCRADLILVEQSQEVRQVLERHRTMVSRDEWSAIELGSPVNERRD